MSSRLDTITDWEARAEMVGFRVSDLARRCRVTDRQLRRYFRFKFGSSPHNWMAATRLQKVAPLLYGDELVKEVAARAGFSRPENFARQFKRLYKATPTALRAQSGAQAP
jgi:AraC-like DNA-binding protein